MRGLWRDRDYDAEAMKPIISIVSAPSLLSDRPAIDKSGAEQTPLCLAPGNPNTLRTEARERDSFLKRLSLQPFFRSLSLIFVFCILNHSPEF